MCYKDIFYMSVTDYECHHECHTGVFFTTAHDACTVKLRTE